MAKIKKFQWRERDDGSFHFQPKKTRWTYRVRSLLPEIQGVELVIIDNNYIDRHIVLNIYGSVKQAKEAGELHYHLIDNFWIDPPFATETPNPNLNMASQYSA